MTNRYPRPRRPYDRKDWNQDAPRIDYSENYNPSKGTYFKGVYDADGNYADLD